MTGAPAHTGNVVRVGSELITLGTHSQISTDGVNWQDALIRRPCRAELRRLAPGRTATRLTRRPSHSVTTRRHASDRHLVADDRQPAEARHHEAAERLVRAGGQLEPAALGEVGEVDPAVDVGRADRLRLGHRVVLVVDLADQFLDQILERDDAGRAAVLVDDDRQMVTLAAHLGQRGEHVLAGRQPADLAGERADAWCARPVRSAASAGRAGGRSRRCRRATPSMTGKRECGVSRIVRTASATSRSASR